jgi:hypothetical protein
LDKPGLEGGVFLSPYVGLIRLDRLKIAGRVEMQREVCEALGNCGEDLPISCFGVDLPPPRRLDDEIEYRRAGRPGSGDDCSSRS